MNELRGKKIYVSVSDESVITPPPNLTGAPNVLTWENTAQTTSGTDKFSLRGIYAPIQLNYNKYHTSKYFVPLNTCKVNFYVFLSVQKNWYYKTTCVT